MMTEFTAEFNVGDRVRLVEMYEGLPSGSPGSVLSIGEYGYSWPNEVKFDDFTDEMLNEIGDHRGWIMADHEIELVEESAL